MTLCLILITFVFLFITICNSAFWPKVKKTSLQYRNLVTILIPARNEEDNLPKCLDQVLLQGAVVAEILIYDDHSTDQTSQIIDDYSSRFPQIKLVSPLVLPPGWCGKSFACYQVAKQATGEWLLFLDADARLEPNAVNRMIAEAQSRQITFLSCWPRFQMETFAERLLMPLLNFVVFSIFPSPLLFIKRPEFEFNARLGLAHGACMLFERNSYEAFGGHELVKDQIFEDTRIAQLWRATFRKGLCLDGQEIVHLRMYTSFDEIWNGFQKNIYPAFQQKYNFWLFLSLHIFVFLIPFILIVTLPTFPLLWVILIILLIRVMIVVRFKQPLISALFHPFGEFLLIVLGISSWWRCKYGKGVIWKGRAYQKSL
jgi:glycosyltransferase involved in cell wall biosynthesis